MASVVRAGGHRSGTAGGDRPTTWDEATGANIKWKVAIPGRGSGSPIVWGDRIFLLTAIRSIDFGRLKQRIGRRQRRRIRKFSRSFLTNHHPALLSVKIGRRAGVAEREVKGEVDPAAGGADSAVVPPTSYYQFVLLCLDRRTGETIWQRTASERCLTKGTIKRTLSHLHRPSRMASVSTPSLVHADYIATISMATCSGRKTGRYANP